MQVQLTGWDELIPALIYAERKIKFALLSSCGALLLCSGEGCEVSSVKTVLQYKFWLVESCHMTSRLRPHVIQSPLRPRPLLGPRPLLRSRTPCHAHIRVRVSLRARIRVRVSCHVTCADSAKIRSLSKNLKSQQKCLMMIQQKMLSKQKFTVTAKRKSADSGKTCCVSKIW